ncbi:hypothetical protein [Deinococcus sp. AJ005]|uniref:hypothetical protein n=1 Tax=Deinococcus sp. AJ005 TaxID=2652443 RepID=UPI00125CBF39|nr:hypothetical protein [Deinococcus sp. AJ005]QFP77773.1 hypothetical protein DAAJ005_15935 [Deinococcus sp. AJ005]
MTGLVEFEHFGAWELSGKQHTFKRTAPDVARGIYVLMVAGKAVYFGKFEGGLESRMSVLKNPPPSQQTHYRLAPLINSELSEGRTVEVGVLDLPAWTRQELKERVSALSQQLNSAWHLR